MEAIREAIIETKAVRFEGNNYSEEWRIGSRKTRTSKFRKTPEALAWLLRPESTEFFQRMAGLMQPEENEARYHVRLERYLKDIEIEIEWLKDIVRTSCAPGSISNSKRAGRIY